MTPSPWWEVEQVAVYLRRDKVRTWREQTLRLFRTKKIKTVKDGNNYLTTKEWVDSYLARRVES